MLKTLLLTFSLLLSAALLTAQWTTEEVSLEQSGMSGTVTANGKVVFAGGFGSNSNPDPDQFRKRVDIYDISSDNWTTEELSVLRQFTFARAVGTRVYFSGYSQTQADDQNVVEVYDTQNDSWSEFTIPISDGATSMTTEGDKIYFVNDDDVVIYNTTNQSTTTATLSVDRILPTAQGCNGKVVFAGGGFAVGTLYSLVDIYDVNTGNWTTAEMEEGRNSIATACMDGKIYLVGGLRDVGDYSLFIDIYDTNTDTWSSMQLNEEKSGMGVAATAQNLYIAGGYSQAVFDQVDEIEIINAATGVKTTDNLSVARSGPAGAATNSRVFFAGGSIGGGNYSNVVDVFNEGTSDLGVVLDPNLSVFPNPVDRELQIDYTGTDQPEYFELTDAYGRIVRSGVYQTTLSLIDLPTGWYALRLDGRADRTNRVMKR